MAEGLDKQDYRDDIEAFMNEVEHAMGIYIRELGCTSGKKDEIMAFCQEQGVEITYDSEYMYILHNGSIVRRFQQPFSTL